jgi:hypothetical protein
MTKSGCPPSSPLIPSRSQTTWVVRRSQYQIYRASKIEEEESLSFERRCQTDYRCQMSQELAIKLDKPLQTDEQRCAFITHQRKRRDTGITTSRVTYDGNVSSYI